MAEKVDHGPRIGADPELFVIAKKGAEFKKNTIVPVCGRIGGTKDAPIVVPREMLSKTFFRTEPEAKGNYAYQEDNAVFEFNIPGFATTDYFNSCIKGYINYLEQHILAPKNLMFAWVNKYTFSAKALEHPLAKVIGCTPDYDAYKPQGQLMRLPFNINDLGTQRFGGGHIHVQYNHENVPREIFAKFMDFLVGLPFLNADKQGDRRNFYGKAGLFRPKEYGIEYRTPSNFWLSENAREENFPYYLSQNVLNLAYYANKDPKTLVDLYRKVPWTEVKKAIDGENVELGNEILNHCRVLVPFNVHDSNSNKQRNKLYYKKAYVAQP